ncbi:hypothetical protein Fcan01_13424 [Folsomia candida]|uniref:Uncharacterized protein n=1 Tax=Folsomia candida TaxID=158441 RepID=A0A226E303_FOLCA|nr:hypothetical protein Fcan01_13424 [Folsomia candida]
MILISQLFLSAFFGWTNAAIANVGLDFNNAQHQEAKRNAPDVPLDLGALKDNPMVKAGLEKAAEVMKHPQVQAILQSEAFKTQMKPENLKKLLDSDTIPKLVTAENIKKMLATPQGQKFLANEQVKAFITSDMFKAYLVKFKEILPQLIVLARTKVDQMLAAQQAG